MKQIDVPKTINTLSDFVKNTITDAGFSEAIIAVSGGIDSAVACAIATRAMRPNRVHTLLLPYGELNKQGVEDATLVLDHLNIPEENRMTVDIQPLVDPILARDPEMDVVRAGNVMARMRMILLFDEAKKQTGLVVGTENKTEHLLGYFTRFGDEASDLEPLRGLYKTQIYDLARELGIPEPVMTKAPTASLWDGQTDEGEFGFTYKEADEILEMLTEKKHTIEQIVALGKDMSIVEKVSNRMKGNAFKHLLPKLPL